MPFPRVFHTDTYLAGAHSKIPANLETLNGAGHLTDLLVAMGSVIGHSACLEHVVVACQVVWKLAASDGESIITTVLRVGANESTIKGHTAMKAFNKKATDTPVADPKHW